MVGWFLQKYQYFEQIMCRKAAQNQICNNLPIVYSVGMSFVWPLLGAVTDEYDP